MTRLTSLRGSPPRRLERPPPPHSGLKASDTMITPTMELLIKTLPLLMTPKAAADIKALCMLMSVCHSADWCERTAAETLEEILSSAPSDVAAPIRAELAELAPPAPPATR